MVTPSGEAVNAVAEHEWGAVERLRDLVMVDGFCVGDVLPQRCRYAVDQLSHNYIWLRWKKQREIAPTAFERGDRTSHEPEPSQITIRV